MEDINKKDDNIIYCKSCRCRYIRTNEDYNRMGELYKTCSKCRIKNSKRPKMIKMSKDLKKCPDCCRIWKEDDGIWEIGTPWDSNKFEICPNCSKLNDEIVSV